MPGTGGTVTFKYDPFRAEDREGVHPELESQLSRTTSTTRTMSLRRSMPTEMSWRVMHRAQELMSRWLSCGQARPHFTSRTDSAPSLRLAARQAPWPIRTRTRPSAISRHRPVRLETPFSKLDATMIRKLVCATTAPDTTIRQLGASSVRIQPDLEEALISTTM